MSNALTHVRALGVPACQLCPDGVGLHLVCGTCLNEKCGDRDVHDEKLGVAVAALEEITRHRSSDENVGDPLAYWVSLVGTFRGLAREALTKIERKE